MGKMSFSFNPFDRENFEHWKLCMNNKLLKSLRNFIFYCQNNTLYFVQCLLNSLNETVNSFGQTLDEEHFC